MPRALEPPMIRRFLLIIPLLLPQECFCTSKLPLPRFVSTASSEANLRVGPGVNYPVDWMFLKKNIPLEVTAEFDTWRRVRDYDGTEGWFHRSMLKSQRYGVVNPPVATLRKSNSPTSAGVIKLAQGVIVRIKKCRDAWCFVSKDKHSGWLLRTEIWGVYDNEKVG